MPRGDGVDRLEGPGGQQVWPGPFSQGAGASGYLPMAAAWQLSRERLSRAEQS